MHRSGDYGLVDVDDAQLLALPYEGGAVAMVVILPRRQDGLPDIEAKLASKLGAWLELLDGGRTGEVDVYLPRFRVASALRLDEALKRLGMPLAFDLERADFSGMTGRRDLCIGAVLHKAFVEVNEQGTTAAAATAVMAMPAAARPRRSPCFGRTTPSCSSSSTRAPGACSSWDGFSTLRETFDAHVLTRGPEASAVPSTDDADHAPRPRLLSRYPASGP